MRRRNVMLAVIVVLAGFAHSTHAQTDTTFTYQGELKQDGSLANGSFNIAFALWDAAIGGSQVGSTITLNGVQVTEGRFTVQLDFGAFEFDNDERWLALTVNGTTLAPRQPITRSPYAIQTRGIYVNSSASRVGIGTTMPAAPLHVYTDAGDSNALFARNTQGTGIFGQSNGTDGRGVFGFATTTTGQNFGVYGLSASGQGRGVFGHASGTVGVNYGVYGLTSSGSGRGVFGYASSTSGAGSSGVSGENDSPAGIGVFGRVNANSGVNWGVRGETNSPNGYAGYFIGGRNYFGGNVGIGNSNPNNPLDVEATSGTAGHFVSGNTGLVCQTTATGGGNYGVFGQHPSGSSFGVFASGNMGASGTKSFRIDHPLDPSYKYLIHYCAESPEPLNVYSGTIALDVNGEAWVELPEYFEFINKDLRYQLTCIGGYANVYIAEKVRDNRFKIAGGRHGLKVSWEVKGVRNDLWVRANGAPTEVAKPEHLQGLYQRPELYGLSQDFAECPPQVQEEQQE